MKVDKQATKAAAAITLQQWLNMWGRLCHGAAGLSGFPIWVQLLPEVFFEVIDRDRKYSVSKRFLKVAQTLRKSSPISRKNTPKYYPEK